MGNFLFDSPTGAAIGALAGKLMRDNWNDRSYLKANKIYDNMQSNTEEDYQQAARRLLDTYGYGSLVGKSPRQALTDQKNAYESYKTAGDMANANQAHQNAEFIRQLGGSQGWDLRGLGANDTTESANQMLRNPLAAQQAQAYVSDLQSMTSQAMSSLSSQAPVAANLGDGLMPNGQNIQEFLRSVSIPGEKSEANSAILKGKSMEQFLRDLPNGSPRNGADPIITQEDVMAGLQNNPEAQIMKSGLLEGALQRRLASPNFTRQYEAAMRAQHVDPEVMERVLGQTQMERDNDEVERYISRFADPGMQNLMRIALKQPGMAAYAAAVGITPKDQYKVGVARENAAINHGYNMETLGKNFEYGQKAADNQLKRTLDQLTKEHGFAVDLKKFDYGAQQELYKLLAQLGIGKNGSAIKNTTGNQQYKNALEIVKARQKAHQNDLEDSWTKDDELYQKAMAILEQGIMQEAGSPGTDGEEKKSIQRKYINGKRTYDTNDYYDGVALVTDAIEEGWDKERIKKQVSQWKEADAIIKHTGL